MRLRTILLNALVLLTERVCSYPGEQYNLSPSSRTVQPVSIYRTTGSVTVNGTAISENVSTDAVFELSGVNATVTYDFGQMTAGYPTFTFGNSSCEGCSTAMLPDFTCGVGCNGLGLAYTEAEQFIGVASDNSTFYTHLDGTLFLPVLDGQQYTVPTNWTRGSFRYLTISLPTQATAHQSVSVKLVGVSFTAQPSLNPPNAYAGYFECSDDLLNRIWHAGAYSMQLSTVSANSSINHLRIPDATGWSADSSVETLTGEDEILSDGAKRDRNPWAGDLGVSIRSSVVFAENLVSIRNSLKGVLVLQNKTSGRFPWAGSPFGPLIGPQFYASDTYHLWTIIGFCEYVLSSGDIAFGNENWHQIVAGIQSTDSFVDLTTGLVNGTGSNDWGRVGQSGQSVSLNSLYSYALSSSAQTAAYLGQSSPRDWTDRATSVKEAINTQLYDNSTGLFWDNTTSAGHELHPQDGNVLALLFNITKSPAQALAIAEGLAARHTNFGAPAPELPGSISPFISGLETIAQITASPNNSSRALSLTRTQWGYMLNAFSNSTLIEGYGTDGSLNYGFYPNGAGFISHAHAWSSGPMYLLSSLIAGLRASVFDVPGTDGDWVFQPSVAGSNLTEVEAGFVRAEGSYSSAWRVTGKEFLAHFTVPCGTVGTVYVPLWEEAREYSVDGKKVDRGKAENGSTPGFMRVPEVGGGSHSIWVRW